MKPEFRLTIFALLSVLIVWVLYLLVVPYLFQRDWDESGRFGDTFGSERSVYGSRVCGSSFATLIQQSRKIDETKRDVEGGNVSCRSGLQSWSLNRLRRWLWLLD